MTPSRRSLWLDIEHVRRGLFGTPLNSIITLSVLAMLAWVVPPMTRWALIDAVWTGTAEDCRAASGACWAFISAKLKFITFAFYPQDLLGRPLLCLLLIAGLLCITAVPRFWGRALLLAWPVTLVAAWLLLSGAVIPPRVSSNQFGGFPITLLVWATCFGVALPLALGLALARRSSMGGLRILSVCFIELMRSTPMVAILYVAMLILPMAIPNGSSVDKISRAMIMIMLFWAAYLAEVLRAGLQAIPAGQSDAAASLGLGYWRAMRFVILPQALRVVIPGLVNLAIGFFLATSLLTVIGVFDLLNAARAAATDPLWLGFYDESYIFVAMVFFAICFCGSRYSRWLERRLATGTANAADRWSS